MLRFLDAQLGHAPNSLAPAIALARQPRADADAKGTRIGLGWLIRKSKDGRTRIWHNGGTGGYRSFAAFDPDARIGVVVLANTDAEVDTIGAEVFLALLPAPPPKPEAAPR